MILTALVCYFSAHASPATLLSENQQEPKIGGKSARQSTRIRVPYEKYTLPNGMKVILHVDKTLPVATINTWFYVGSKDEPERRSGFAHLFEHLMFMGTKRVPVGQFDSIMESVGGFNNASTAQDRTNYYSYGPSNILPTLLWLDADRFEDLANEMNQQKLDLQRDVVKNERRQTSENTPYGKAYEAMSRLLFPKEHPYSNSVIGLHEDLTAASVDDVKNFFNTFYVPNNASLVVAGDFDPKVIKPMISKLFGTLPRRDDPPRKIVQPFNFVPKIYTMVDDVPARKVLKFWHGPKMGSKSDIPIRIAADILGRGLNSRLNQEIVVKQKLATDIAASFEPLFYGGLFYIDATASPQVPLQKLEAAIDQTLAQLSYSGPTSSEIVRVANRTESDLATRLQSIDQKADLLNFFEFYYGEPDSFQRELDRIRNTTSKSISSALAELLKRGALTLRVIPKSSDSTSDSGEKSPRDEAPKPLAEVPFSTPKPLKEPLLNGLIGSIWSRANVPITELAVRIPAGSILDPVGKEGLTAMTIELMVRGAKKLNSGEFSSQLDSLGASIEGSVDVSQAIIQLSVPSSNRVAGTAWLSAVIAQPTLSSSDFNVLKESTIARVEEEDANPAALATKVARRAFFGANSPLAKSPSRASIQAIRLEDVKRQYAQLLQFRPEIFSASGLNVTEQRALLTTFLKAVKFGMNSSPKITLPPVSDQGRLIIVDRPGSVQTVIQGWLPGLTWKSDNYLALKMSNVILGGSFTSRLNQNLREDKGYTYGASARTSESQLYGSMNLGTSVRSDVTGVSITEILKELRKIQSGDISQEESKKAYQQFRTELISQFTSLSEIVGANVRSTNIGQTFADLDQMLKKASQIDEQKLNAFARSQYDSSRVLWVLVGNAAEIQKQISGLGLPKAEVITSK